MCVLYVSVCWWLRVTLSNMRIHVAYEMFRLIHTVELLRFVRRKCQMFSRGICRFGSLWLCLEHEGDDQMFVDVGRECDRHANLMSMPLKKRIGWVPICIRKSRPVLDFPDSPSDMCARFARMVHRSVVRYSKWKCVLKQQKTTQLWIFVNICFLVLPS